MSAITKARKELFESVGEISVMRLFEKFDEMKHGGSLRKQIYFVYFSYPYSENPKETTEDIRLRVSQLLTELRPDLARRIVPLIPHLAFDAIYSQPAGYTHSEMGIWEMEIISRCDILVYDPTRMSSGVRWELVIAEYLGKRIMTFQELVDHGVD